MNMPTHGQGYMDINSVIPELVNKIECGKGRYYAEVGDFSSAGYSKLFSVDKLPEGILKFAGGEFNFYNGDWGLSVNGKGYSNDWTATHQASLG